MFEERISASVSTFDPLSEKGELLVEFVEEFLERIVRPLNIELEYHAEGKRVRPKFYPFTEESWKKNKEKLKKGDLYSFQLWHLDEKLRETPIGAPTGLRLVITDYEELFKRKIPKIYIEVHKWYCGEKFSLEIQQTFVDLIDKLVAGLNSTGGVIVHDRVAGAAVTAHESYIGFQYVSDSMKLKEYFRGYQWGNYLSPIHVNSLGGLEKVEKEAPVFLSKRFPDGGIYLQLTEDIEEVTDDNLRQLKQYFKPILLPKTCNLPPQAYANMRVIED